MDNVKLVAISSAIRGLGFSSIWIYSSIYMYGILGVPTFFISLVFMVGGTISSFAMYAGGKLGDIMGHKLVYSLFLHGEISEILKTKKKNQSFWKNQSERKM